MGKDSDGMSLAWIPRERPSTLRSINSPSQRLFERARDGVDDAWQKLGERYSASLARHVRLQIGDLTATREIIQLALDQAKGRISECTDAAEFPAWLRGLADQIIDSREG